MNFAFAQLFNECSRLRRRFACGLTLSLTVFLSAAAPVLAEPVRINQVVQTVSTQAIADLKLNTLVTQDPASGTKSSTQQTGPRSETAGTQGQGGTKTESLLSGITVSEGQQLGIEVIEEGEVEGTVCDCGEILIAGASFPKWPLVFLTAVPFIFINECDNCDEISNPTPTPPSIPTPAPTPTPTPEPASLLLFGTGLLAAGAGLRRRYAKAKRIKKKEEEYDVVDT